MNSKTILVCALALVALPATADDLRRFLGTPVADARGGPVLAPAACQGGLRNDDGSFEGATGYANAVQRGAYVMALEIPPDFQPARVCLCWTRGPFNNGPDVDFDVVFYANDGFGPDPLGGGRGYPGTELGRVSAHAGDVPEFNVDGVGMYPVQLPPELATLSGFVFVGAEWEPFVHRQFFLCNDAEVETQLRPVHDAWSNVPPEPFWSPVSPLRPTYRSLGTVLYGNAVHAGDFECAPQRPGCPPAPP